MDTRDATPGLKLADQLCFALYDASRAVIRAYGPLLSSVGLTYPQYLVMLVLWEADGPVSVGEIGNALHLENGTLTPVLKRLVQQGFITRMRDVEDERRVLISLSADGHQLESRVTEIPGQVFEGCLVDVESARSLHATLTQVARSFDPA
jgi:DNA-binding MarR family transcriptional regulator